MLTPDKHGWIVPVIISLLILGVQMYEAMNKVDDIQAVQIKNTDARLELQYRIERLEEFCCQEINDGHNR